VTKVREPNWSGPCLVDSASSHRMKPLASFARKGSCNQANHRTSPASRKSAVANVVANDAASYASHRRCRMAPKSHMDDPPGREHPLARLGAS
jgi:hypothetical protein